MGLIRNVCNSWDRKSLAYRFRRSRFGFFTSLLAGLEGPVRILDIGGVEQYWSAMGRPGADAHITLLNLRRKETRLPWVQSIAGDARDLKGIADNEYDVAFSNSVIEHLGSLEDQRRMAGEVRRVAPRYLVQTPNRHFPLEPHFIFPFFQYLPFGAKVRVATRWKAGWYSSPGDPVRARRNVEEVRLLTCRELRDLFPGGVIRRERVLGLTKSFTVLGGW